MLAKHAEEEGENAVWAITYGDLMSYLMIFFLFLYAFAVQDDYKKQEMVSAMREELGGEKKAAAKQALPAELQAAEKLKEKLESAGMRSVADVETDKLFVRVTLGEKVLFKSGQAELLPEAVPIIHEFAQASRELDNDIMIEGHTDNVPLGKHVAFKSNWELSLARAHTILKHLVEHEGFPPQHLAAVGYGEYRPLVPNDSPEHRAQNRRIEITIIRRPTWGGEAPAKRPAEGQAAAKPEAPAQHSRPYGSTRF